VEIVVGLSIPEGITKEKLKYLILDLKENQLSELFEQFRRMNAHKNLINKHEINIVQCKDNQH
jgi:hypothetical protein